MAPEPAHPAAPAPPRPLLPPAALSGSASGRRLADVGRSSSAESDETTRKSATSVPRSVSSNSSEHLGLAPLRPQPDLPAAKAASPSRIPIASPQRSPPQADGGLAQRLWSVIALGDSKDPLRLREDASDAALQHTFGEAQARFVRLVFGAPSLAAGWAQAQQHANGDAQLAPVGSMLLRACLVGRRSLNGQRDDAAPWSAIDSVRSALFFSLRTLLKANAAAVPAEAEQAAEWASLTAMACGFADAAALKELLYADRKNTVCAQILDRVHSWQNSTPEDVDRLVEEVPELRLLWRRGAKANAAQADSACEILLLACLHLQTQRPKKEIRPLLQLFAEVSLRAHFQTAFTAVLAQAPSREERALLATGLIHRTLTERFYAGTQACLAAGADASVRRGTARCRRLLSGFTPLHTLAATVADKEIPHALLQALLEAGAQPLAVAESPPQTFREPMQPVNAGTVALLLGRHELARALFSLAEEPEATSHRARALADLLALVTEALGGVLMNPRASIDDFEATLEPALREFSQIYLDYGVGVGNADEVLFARQLWTVSEKLKELIDEENTRREADSPPPSPSPNEDARHGLLFVVGEAQRAALSLQQADVAAPWRGKSLAACEVRLRQLGASEIGAMREAWYHGVLRPLPLLATLKWADGLFAPARRFLPESDYDAVAAFCLSLGGSRDEPPASPSTALPAVAAELLRHASQPVQLIFFLHCALQMRNAVVVRLTLQRCRERKVQFDELGVHGLPRMMWLAVDAPHPMFCDLLEAFAGTAAFGAWLKLKNESGENLLHMAVRTDDSRAEKLLQASDAYADRLTKECDLVGRTPLMLAMELGHVRAAAALTRARPPPLAMPHEITAALVHNFCAVSATTLEPLRHAPELKRLVEALTPAMVFAAAWRDDAKSLYALLRSDDKLFFVRNAKDETVLHCIARASAEKAWKVMTRIAPAETLATLAASRNSAGQLPYQCAVSSDIALALRTIPEPPRSPSRPNWFKKPTSPYLWDRQLLPPVPPVVAPSRLTTVSPRKQAERRNFFGRFYAEPQRARRERLVGDIINEQIRIADPQRPAPGSALVTDATWWALDSAWELIQALNELDQEHAFGHGFSACMPLADESVRPGRGGVEPFFFTDALALLRMRNRALQLAERIDDDDFSAYAIVADDPDLDVAASSGRRRHRRAVQFSLRRSCLESSPRIQILRVVPLKDRVVEPWELWQLKRP